MHFLVIYNNDRSAYQPNHFCERTIRLTCVIDVSKLWSGAQV
uniref:Uncharacterized protein n=1 Tax=Anguilla anguilla TaxID=7936 RepID=A0A0E9TD87_ANGAN